MEGITYTIKEMIEEFRKDMKSSLDRIEAQTIRTNGRVNSLEKSRIEIWTAISIFTVVTGAIIYLSISVIDSKIDNGIAKALKENVSRVEIEQ